MLTHSYFQIFGSCGVLFQARGKANMIRAIIFAGIAIVAIQQQATADAEFGDKICKTMRGTGMVARCSSLDANKIISAFIHTSSEEASSMCKGIVRETSHYTRSGKGWTLRIYSPFDRSVPLASCRF